MKNSNAKKGIVLEGGALRGMFTAGVLDVIMEADLKFDGAVGTSAGAVFGCNLKSKQIGRVIRYNKRFCNDKRYVGFNNLFKTGDLYPKEFCYHTVPLELDPFDTETFKNNPMDFYVTCTDVETGKAVYYKCKDGSEKDIEWMRASASMPMFANIVKIGGRKLLDGGVGDSIPLRFFEHKGYEKIVVVLTQPYDYVKKKNKFLPVIKKVYHNYPDFIKAIANRHLRYNKTIDYIKQLEDQGEIFVIRPAESLKIGSMEKNPAELERVYRMGREAAEKSLKALELYLNN